MCCSVHVKCWSNPRPSSITLCYKDRNVPKEINTEYIVKQARYAGEEAGAKMLEVHGRLWEGRENLAKLIISLSSAMLVGTITFSGSLLGSNSSFTTCPNLLVTSWVLLFFTMSLGLLSLWHSNTLKSFRAMFFNSEPQIEEKASQLNSEASQDGRWAKTISGITLRPRRLIGHLL